MDDKVKESEEEQLAEGTLLSHLIELRSRLMKSMLAIAVVLVCLLPFTQKIFTLIARPLLDKLPAGSAMITTRPAGPFLTPFKTTLFVALFLAMPAVLYQIWPFVAPGLYKREKRFALPLFVSSIVLFYVGVAFAYYVIFPIMFAFFTASAPEGVQVAPDISEYLDFVLTLFFAFGVAFEVPIATVLLIWTGLISVDKLKGARPYVFLGCFVIGMFLTPPDMLSQTLLALPMYALYEGGIWMARILLPEKMAPVPQKE
jgi:sec-independent protein translocase protein TatC